MAVPAVKDDVIKGSCTAGHLVPSPSGGPMPAPPLPFVGPLADGLVTKVTIGGKPVAVVGSSGRNTPLHPGLHASDPAQVATDLQVGRVLDGARTVTFGGAPAATSQSTCQICGGTATIATTVTNVTVE
jgi:uncharacterized Zn-binding protein involved in type VI secretion